MGGVRVYSPSRLFQTLVSIREGGSKADDLLEKLHGPTQAERGFLKCSPWGSNPRGYSDWRPSEVDWLQSLMLKFSTSSYLPESIFFDIFMYICGSNINDKMTF